MNNLLRLFADVALDPFEDFYYDFDPNYISVHFIVLLIPVLIIIGLLIAVIILAVKHSKLKKTIAGQRFGPAMNMAQPPPLQPDHQRMQVPGPGGDVSYPAPYQQPSPQAEVTGGQSLYQQAGGIYGQAGYVGSEPMDQGNFGRNQGQFGPVDSSDIAHPSETFQQPHQPVQPFNQPQSPQYGNPNLGYDGNQGGYAMGAGAQIGERPLQGGYPAEQTSPTAGYQDGYHAPDSSDYSQATYSTEGAKYPDYMTKKAGYRPHNSSAEEASDFADINPTFTQALRNDAVPQYGVTAANDAAPSYGDKVVSDAAPEYGETVMPDVSANSEAPAPGFATPDSTGTGRDITSHVNQSDSLSTAHQGEDLSQGLSDQDALTDLSTNDAGFPETEQSVSESDGTDAENKSQ
ncbi:MAG TPA: hypothetical protein GX717_08545 [Clostridiaceae bacterium]|nr:hypothetical protein [Clostridiaceae bacterium]